MRPRILFPILAILALALTGCAARSEKKMTAVMSSYAGQPISTVMQAWGPPNAVYDEAGMKNYVWTEESSYQLPGHTHGSYVYPGPTLRATNFRVFTVDKDGRIVAWKVGRRTS